MHPCRRCNETGPFYRSYTDHSNYVCKACASILVAESRKRDPQRLLAYRWYNALRRRGIYHSNVAGDVALIVKRWTLQSVISGETNINQLCIFPFFSDLPVAPWHCVIVTMREARTLSHLRHSPEKFESLFPAQLCAQMKEARSAIVK
jgi:hypothetical protein